MLLIQIDGHGSTHMLINNDILVTAFQNPPRVCFAKSFIHLLDAPDDPDRRLPECRNQCSFNKPLSPTMGALSSAFRRIHSLMASTAASSTVSGNEIS